MGVACDLGYPCAKFRLPRPFGFRVRADVRDIRRTDGRTTDADHRIMPPRRGHNNNIAEETCVCLHSVAGRCLWLTVITHQSSTTESTDNAVRPSVRRLYAVRRQEAAVTARPPADPAERRESRSCRRVRPSSRDDSASRVSLTRYRLSQRRYGVVDNNGDFSSIR